VDVARKRFSGILDELLERSHVSGPGSATDNRVATIERQSNFFLAYQGEDDKELQTKYGRLVRNLLQLQGADKRRNQSIATTGRRVRIAFASSFFRESTVGHYFMSWITDLDPLRFEVTVFLLGGREDSLTDVLRAAAFRTICAEGALSSVIATLTETRPDILVYPEIGMDGRTYALAAHRIAPVQCAAWGHPVTTGLPTIDFYFSCAAMEPPDAPLHYTEKLKLLPGLGTRYPRPVSGGGISLDALGLPSDANLYLFPHPPYKVHPENDSLLCEILEQDPQGVLVLCAGVDPVANTLLAERLAALFGQRAIGSNRWRVLPHMSRESFLDLNRQCVVMLDTTRWSGGNTTLDALSVGLPVVTRCGEFMRGRQSASMLEMLGISELVVSTDRDYVGLALELGRNKAYRNNLSARIVAAHEQLFDRHQPIVALQSLFLELVESGR
jgi:CRISPR-associated protein Csy1